MAKGPYLGCSSPRASGLWPGFESPFCALAVTMHFHDHDIDHGVFHIWLAADGIKAFLPDTGLDPVAKALEDGCICHILRASHARGCLCARSTAWPVQTSACPRLLALHRQACPDSSGPSVPTACRLMLFFPWRYRSTRGEFSTDPSGNCARRLLRPLNSLLFLGPPPSHRPLWQADRSSGKKTPTPFYGSGRGWQVLATGVFSAGARSATFPGNGCWCRRGGIWRPPSARGAARCWC